MHVVIHTQYYPPEIGAPQARLSALARGLSARGHRVTILTAMPNYPRGVLYDGYGGWLKREQVDGIRIIRTGIHATTNRSFLPRLLNYFSFVVSSLIAGVLFLERPDIILTESPPLFLGISGYLLSCWKRARWAFNVSDLWPESAVRLGVLNQGLLLKMSYWLEAFCYRRAWCVSGQSREILESIHARFPGVRTYHLSNGADTDFFTPGDRAPGNLSGDVVGMYAGLHGLAQGLDQLLMAAYQLLDLPALKFVLIGDGPLKSKLMAQSTELKLTNVQFLEPLSRSEMPGALASADFCIVPLGLELPGAVPSKLYEAMAAGRAVILMAAGEAAAIVRDQNCGLISEPGDIVSLVRNLRQLAGDRELRDELGANGRRAAVTHYDHTVLLERFAAFLESM